MVAALAAAVSKIGPKLASTGGKWMHSANPAVRRAGSSMLGGKTEKALVKISGKMENALKIAGMINKSIKKILNVLSSASPALKQQLIIIHKGIQVMLRPIGDVMAKFLRPMAVWVMKVAQKWYAMFGTGAGDKDSPSVIEDAIKQLKVEQESALISGDPAKAARIGEQIAGLETKKESQLGGSDSGGGFFDSIKNTIDNLAGDWATALSSIGDKITTWAGDIWTKFIPESFRETLDAAKEAFRDLWDVMKMLWEIVKPIVKPVAAFVAALVGLVAGGVLKVLTSIFKHLSFQFKVITFVLGLFKASWVIFINLIEKFYHFIKDKLSVAFPNLKATMETFGNWVSTTWSNVWTGLKSAIAGIVDWIATKIQWLKNLNPFGGGDDESGQRAKAKSKAVGGFINKTGQYMLHAGERVVTAGDVSRQDIGRPVEFSSVVNVSATINNEMDIRELASKLADYNETELRRRVSYI